MPDADRAKLIRDLDKAARDASSHVNMLSFKVRTLLEAEDDPDMPPRDVVDLDNALREAVSALMTVKQILGKRARRLDGPPPALVFSETAEPGRLNIIARTPEGDLIVGQALKDAGSGADGSRENWRARLTDIGGGRTRASIGGHESPDEVMEHLGRFMDDHGPWWTRPAATAAGKED